MVLGPTKNGKDMFAERLPGLHEELEEGAKLEEEKQMKSARAYLPIPKDLEQFAIKVCIIPVILKVPKVFLS